MHNIQVGDAVPSVTMYGASPGDKINLAEHVGTKTVVMFGVPGAFTPGCSKVTCFLKLSYRARHS